MSTSCSHTVCMVAQLSLAFWDLMDCSPPGSSAHGIFQVRILEWVAISSFRESSQPKDHTYISFVSCVGKRILYPYHYLGSTLLCAKHRKEKKNAFSLRNCPLPHQENYQVVRQCRIPVEMKVSKWRALWLVVTAYGKNHGPKWTQHRKSLAPVAVRAGNSRRSGAVGLLGKAKCSPCWLSPEARQLPKETLSKGTSSGYLVGNSKKNAVAKQ